jgi:hypothetical protein
LVLDFYLDLRRSLLTKFASPPYPSLNRGQIEELYLVYIKELSALDATPSVPLNMLKNLMGLEPPKCGISNCESSA